MCKYCDVRMPDGCGFELKSKDDNVKLLTYPGGNVHINYQDKFEDTYHDTVKFNYCPMCGKPLDDNTDELTQNEAREYAEEIASEYDAADVLTVAVVQSNTCTVRCCWDDE